jgi:hypothetical protein
MHFISRKIGLSRATIFVLLSAVPYFLFWLHYFPNLSNTNDVHHHIAYIRHVAQNWAQPYEYWGRENWHPPLYYYITALVYSVSNHITYEDPFTAVRLVSLVFYMIFCIYAVRCLRTVFLNENLAYYTGVVLIVFWPASIIMATRINNDIAMYAAWSAVFYYLAQWYKDRNIKLLHYTIIALGIAFMVKSNAVIPLAIVCAVVAFSLASGQLQWKQLFLRSHLPALAVFLLGILINAGKMIYVRLSHGNDISHIHFGESGDSAASVAHFITFDVIQYITQPFNMLREDPTFFNNFLKTMLYGEFTWKYDGFASVINTLFIAFLFIMICSALINVLRNKQYFIELMPYLAGLIVPLLAVMAFYAIKKLTVCQDFRFALPMLVPMVILYVKGLDYLHTLGTARSLYWAGITVGWLLPLAGVVFYLAQYLW